MDVKKKKKPVAKIILSSLGGLGAIFIFAFLIWSCNPWTGNQEAKTALNSNTQVTVSESKDGTLIMTPAESTGRCLMFYSGAHVLNTAYAPLLNSFANIGYTVFAPKFPFNYAILNTDKAEEIMSDQFLSANCQTWVGVGHSLGASALSRYVAKNPDVFESVMLLAASPRFFTKDLSNYQGNLGMVIGDRDGVINLGKWENLRDRLPETAFLVTIPGANHVQYGNYDGPIDNEAKISRVEQQMMTLETLLILTNQYDPSLLMESSTSAQNTN